MYYCYSICITDHELLDWSISSTWYNALRYLIIPCTNVKKISIKINPDFLDKSTDHTGSLHSVALYTSVYAWHYMKYWCLYTYIVCKHTSPKGQGQGHKLEMYMHQHLSGTCTVKINDAPPWTTLTQISNQQKPHSKTFLNLEYYTILNWYINVYSFICIYVL